MAVSSPCMETEDAVSPEKAQKKIYPKQEKLDIAAGGNDESSSSEELAETRVAPDRVKHHVTHSESTASKL